MTSSKKSTSENKGVEIRIRGIVQGVGFRPFIYNLATSKGISGTVSNTSAGVFIQAAGSASALEDFVSAITAHRPPLAEIHALDTTPLDAPPENDDFRILASDGAAAASTAIPPDIALCRDCRAEMLSASDRRYGYPFINCTNCGPRFTIVETIPYDRPQTSMKVFAMCPDCQREYDNPQDRRFHAQPNACPVCGPQLSWHDRAGSPISCDDPVRAAVAALAAGRILAIRGLGGFHLAADATSAATIERLRGRKRRPSKPLAVMVADLATARRYCHISVEEAAELESPRHPIVLLRRGGEVALPENLCPGVDDIGLMLPYTPLHHLLFASPGCPPALVMTSGNLSGRPICISNEAALAQLGTVADNFLLHNREILTRVDDSVGKRMAGAFRLFRRARGYCPTPILLPAELPQGLGTGGGLKSTFALSRGNQGFISQHIGDLFNLESYEFYLESVRHHLQVFEIEPELVVRDLHPDYLSSRYADELGLPLYTVQHHHAHAAAVIAEHHLPGPVLAVVLDGTGYGPDGTIWGGEILKCDLLDYHRLAHLQPLPLPGGDKAAEEPWRMAVSALHRLRGRDGLAKKYLPERLATIERGQLETVALMIENGFNSPATSSCGRLFDAAAALLDLRLRCDFEGQAAMELEALAAKSRKGDWRRSLDALMDRQEPLFFTAGDGKGEIISSEFVKLILDKRAQGCSASQIALAFHFELVAAIARLVTQLSTRHNIDTVILSGGCLQNRLLMEGLFHALAGEGLQVHTGAKVPVNDGGISFGQINIGGLHHVSRHSHAGNRSQR